MQMNIKTYRTQIYEINNNNKDFDTYICEIYMKEKKIPLDIMYSLYKLHKQLSVSQYVNYCAAYINTNFRFLLNVQYATSTCKMKTKDLNKDIKVNVRAEQINIIQNRQHDTVTQILPDSEPDYTVSESVHKCPAKGQHGIGFFQIFFKIPRGIANIFDHCVILWGRMHAPPSSMPPFLALPLSYTDTTTQCLPICTEKHRSGLFID